MNLIKPSAEPSASSGDKATNVKLDGRESFAVGEAGFRSWTRRALPSTPTGAFWLVSVASLAGCYLLFLLAPFTGMSQSFPVFGQDGYFELARSLVRGDGFVFEAGGPPAHHRPPLYPLVLTPLALLPDHLLLPALVLLHSLMLGCVGALIFKISRLTFDLSVARGALVIFLANPWLYANVKNPLTPVLQSLLYATFIYVLGKAAFPVLTGRNSETDAGRLPPWLMIGSIGGLLSLTHGTLIAVNGAFITILMLLSLRRSEPRLMRTALLAAVISVIIIAPWTYRNWVAFERLIPVVGGGGAMYAYQYRYWTKDRIWADDAAAAGPTATPSSSTPLVWKYHGLTSEPQDAEVNARALDSIRTRPDVFAKGLVLNAIAYYFPSVAEVFRRGDRNFEDREKLALTTFHFTMWLFAGVGLLHVRKRRDLRVAFLLLLLCLLLYAVWYFPFLTSASHTMYTFATMPILAILAAVGLVFGYRAVSQSSGHLELGDGNRPT